MPRPLTGVRSGRTLVGMERFPIRIDLLFRVPMLAIGATRRRSFVELREDGLFIRLGFVRVTIPYADIDAVEPIRWPWWAGLGVRIGPEHTLGLVGSYRNVLRLRLRRPVALKAILTIPASNYAVSVADVDGFQTALARRRPQ
jgi:hypothetical protein